MLVWTLYKLGYLLMIAFCLRKFLTMMTNDYLIPPCITLLHGVMNGGCSLIQIKLFS